MTLTDLWLNSKDQLRKKKVSQLIAFTGQGTLGDENDAQKELRQYLKIIPVEMLERYADECLEKPFPGSGLVLQDIVNQFGERIGFDVEPGRYRGTKKVSGEDGLWKTHNHAIVIEVKTTDAYRIEFNKLYEYRKRLIDSGRISPEKGESSSILVVVGRPKAEKLEEQISVGNYASDVRIVSLEALRRLVRLKEGLENPKTIRSIHRILYEKELNTIVEIICQAADDIISEDGGDELTCDYTNSYLRDNSYKLISDRIGIPDFKKQTRAFYISENRSTALICAVSKMHNTTGQERYWFAFHPYQKTRLEQLNVGLIFVLLRFS